MLFTYHAIHIQYINSEQCESKFTKKTKEYIRIHRENEEEKEHISRTDIKQPHTTNYIRILIILFFPIRNKIETRESFQWCVSILIVQNNPIKNRAESIHSFYHTLTFLFINLYVKYPFNRSEYQKHTNFPYDLMYIYITITHTYKPNRNRNEMKFPKQKKMQKKDNVLYKTIIKINVHFIHTRTQ